VLKSKILIFISISFAIGILYASVFDAQSNFIFFCLAISIVLFFLSFAYKNKFSAFVALFLFFVGLGALRIQSSILPNEYQNFLGEKVELEGYVVEDPSIKTNNQLIIFKPDGYKQNIQINYGLTQEFFYGDRLLVTGKVDLAKPFDNFDYQSYLERYNIYAVTNNPKVLILKSHQLNKLKEFLFKIKYAFITRINSLLNEPQSSLALGVLIGGHGSLPKDVVENFRNAGTSHIIAVSGYNITIIAAALAYSAYIFGRRASFYLSTGTVFCFVIIAGASASVIRAAAMGFLFLLSGHFGRQYSVAPALFLAGLIMLIINPKILFWDVGFQLSFVATLGIVYFVPLLESLTKNWPQVFGIKIIILTTISAIIATLPIILFNFGTFSLIAPLANVLVLPFIPAAMLFGFLSILPFFGQGFAFIANWILVYILKIIEILANLPYSYLSVKISTVIFGVMVAGIFGLYFGLVYLLSRLQRVEASKINLVE
jgi:competence protein ComEC